MNDPHDQLSEEAVRRYLTDVGRRYLPALAFFAGIGLIIALVPSVASSTGGNLGITQQGAPPGLEPTTTIAGISAGPDGTLQQSAGATLGVGVSGGSAGRQGLGSSPGGPASIRAVSGVTCGQGVRQVPWSKYVDYCTPAWSGSNGGSTAPGVTASTITLSYRQSNSSQQAMMGSLFGGGIVSDSALISDLQAYISLFNRSFELYGRKVVLKPYQGQGDYVLEAEGQDLQGAQADAATARQLGAFGDITYPITNTEPYAQALVQQHVIDFGTFTLPQSDYLQWAPYAYSFEPAAEKIGSWATNLICQRLKGFPAVYAGDSTLKAKTRLFGIVVMEEPSNQAIGSTTEAGVKAQCDMEFGQTVNFPFDPAQQQQEAPTIIAQMKSAGVTTLDCMSCGNSMLESLTAQADYQQYYPEWLVPDTGDLAGRLSKQDQMAHALGYSDFTFPPVNIAKAQSEAYRAYSLANPSVQPQEIEFSMAYFDLMQVFDALQLAGPDLNPVTFERAMFAVPTSLLGDDGIWSFGNEGFTAPAASQVVAWHPTVTSQFDGQMGAFMPCDGGAWYSLLDRTTWGALRQLAC